MTQFFLPGFQPPPSDTSDDPAPKGPFAAQRALTGYPHVPPHLRSRFAKIIGRAGKSSSPPSSPVTVSKPRLRPKTSPSTGACGSSPMTE